MLDQDIRLVVGFMEEVSGHIVSDGVETFRHAACRALDEYLGFEFSAFGYLPSNVRGLDLMLTTHNLQNEFVARLFDELSARRGAYTASDLTVFSHRQGFVTSRLMRSVLKPEGFSDGLICYLKHHDVYCGYLVLLKRGTRVAISERELELLRAVTPFLGSAYGQSLAHTSMGNVNAMMVTQTNDYPVGIVIMRNYSEFAYANGEAREYMSALGVPDPRYFGVFFSNTLLPDMQLAVSSLGQRRIVRHQNFVFSVVTYEIPRIGGTEELGYGGEWQGKGVAAYVNASGRDLVSYVYVMRDDVTSRAYDRIAELSLTTGEERVCRLVVLGKSNRDIANELGISPNTVRVHLRNVFAKCGVSSRGELAAMLNGSVARDL